MCGWCAQFTPIEDLAEEFEIDPALQLCECEDRWISCLDLEADVEAKK